MPKGEFQWKTKRRGKGDQDRQLWINEELLGLLRDWREQAPKSAFCFPTLHGTRIHDAYLREMMKRRGRKAGITKDVHTEPLFITSKPAPSL